MNLASVNSLKLFKAHGLTPTKYNRLLPQFASGQLFLADFADRLSVQV